MISLLNYPKGDTFFTIRKSLVEICDNDPKAGLLLNYFITKLAENKAPLISITNDEIYESLMGIVGKKSIIQIRRKLVGKGFISEHKNPNPKYKFDNTIYYQIHIETIQKELNNYNKNTTKKEVL